MSRTSAKKQAPIEEEYKRVFAPYTVTRKRIDGILDGWGDMYPGTGGHAEVESCLVALSEGKPAPYDLSLKPKRGKNRTGKLPESNIIAPVARALAGLFASSREGRVGS